MELFYRTYGEGKPVIILHGLFGISDNWVTIGKKLAENNFCVFIPDQRNHGKSPHDDNFNYNLLSEDLQEFIIQHQIKKPIIIGHSMGGKVAMNYTLKHPESVDKLIVVDMGIKENPPHQNEIFDVLLPIDPGEFSSRAEIENYLSNKIKNPRLVQLLIKNFHLTFDSGFEWKLNLKSIKENYSHILDEITSTSSYNGSVLFIRGELSGYIVDEDLPELKKIFPQAVFKTILGASHWVHADKPIEFYDLVMDFLKNT